MMRLLSTLHFIHDMLLITVGNFTFFHRVGVWTPQPKQMN